MRNKRGGQRGLALCLKEQENYNKISLSADNLYREASAK